MTHPDYPRRCGRGLLARGRSVLQAPIYRRPSSATTVVAAVTASCGGPKSCHFIVPCTEFLIKELARIPRDLARLPIQRFDSRRLRPRLCKSLHAHTRPCRTTPARARARIYRHGRGTRGSSGGVGGGLSFVDFKGLAAAEEITGVFFFSIPSRSLREAGIAVSKAAARKSKTKVSFFLSEGPGYGSHTRYIPLSLYPFLFLLPTPSSSSSSPFRLSPALSASCYRIPAIPDSPPGSMYYLWPCHRLPLLLSLPISLSLSLCLILWRLLFQRTRTCSFCPGSFLSFGGRTDPRSRRRKSKRELFSDTGMDPRGRERTPLVHDVNDPERMCHRPSRPSLRDEHRLGRGVGDRIACSKRKIRDGSRRGMEDLSIVRRSSSLRKYPLRNFGAS